MTTTALPTVPGTLCPTEDHAGCPHPAGATLWLGGTAWAHPKGDAQTALLAPIDSIHPYPGNPRRGDQTAITTSVTDLGFYGTIQTQADTGHILVGNHRWRALTDLGALLAPVEVLAVSDTVAAALVARDNYTSDQADNDPEELRALLEQLEAAEQLHLAGGLAEELAALRAMDAAVVPAGPSLADRFLVPPFSVLDARAGVWQGRKREWLSLGIASEVGRGEEGQTLGAAQTNLDGVDATRYGRERSHSRKPARASTADGSVERIQAQRNPADLGQGMNARRAADGSLEYVPVTAGAGVSIFDPVLCEVAYRWFSAVGARVFDPFAGGSVRGIVATALQRHYTGIELRPEQVAANAEQARAIIPKLASEHAVGHPLWLQGDSREMAGLLKDAHDQHPFDLLFSCPPYADLEVYSDDPADLSAMEWPAFCEAYRQIITAAVARLRPDRFAVWVVGEVRDPRGVYRNLVGETVEAFAAAGARYYNEAILVTPAGSLPIRAGKQFTAGRKLGKTHQQVLVFCKGDPRKATAYCGDVDVAWPEGWDATA